MGCDGGTIPKRDELVRVKKRPEQKDKDAELSFKWKHCALSQQVLQTPIVACGLGRLYSKSSVLESLLDKDNIPDGIKHIKNMKDIRDLNLSKNPSYKDNAEKFDGAIDERGCPYICPISGLEMSGRFRFVLLWSCGCVLSERALKEIKDSVCHLCQQQFTDNDIVIINGNHIDTDLMKEKLLIRQSRLKLQKKNLKEKKLPPVVENTNKPPTAASSSTSKPKDMDSVKEVNLPGMPLQLPRITRDGDQSAVAVKANKRQATSTSMQDPVYKKTKEDYSVAKDPKATDVFKSLFTSHQSDKDQQRAHWITYNPFYN